jgi:hypothetical protein
MCCLHEWYCLRSLGAGSSCILELQGAGAVETLPPTQSLFLHRIISPTLGYSLFFPALLPLSHFQCSDRLNFVACPHSARAANAHRRRHPQPLQGYREVGQGGFRTVLQAAARCESSSYIVNDLANCQVLRPCHTECNHQASRLR